MAALSVADVTEEYVANALHNGTLLLPLQEVIHQRLVDGESVHVVADDAVSDRVVSAGLHSGIRAKRRSEELKPRKGGS